MPQLLPYWLCNTTLRIIDSDTANIVCLLYFLVGIVASCICLLILRSGKHQATNVHYSSYSRCLSVLTPLTCAFLYGAILLTFKLWTDYLENLDPDESISTSVLPICLFLYKLEVILLGGATLCYPTICY